MNVKLNGKQTPLLYPQTVTAFLKEHSIEPSTPGIAIAINGNIVFRADWNGKLLAEGDEIEIVHAVQGG